MMTFTQGLIITVSGMLGAVGFSALFRCDKRRVLCNAVGGALVCVIYVICCDKSDDVFWQNFFPALFATIYAEAMARAMKAPATPILACSIIPLVPGGKLYYTTYYIVTSQPDLFRTCLRETLLIAAGLAVGIICVSVVFHEINRHKFKQIIDVD